MTTTIISMFAIMFALVALILSCVCISIVVGLRNSTHKIEYMPVPTPEPDMSFKPEDIEKFDVLGAQAEMEEKLKKDMKLNPVVAGLSKFYED
jgi:hypothetical protein